MQRGADAGVSVSMKRAQGSGALEVIEVHRTCRTTRDQNASVCREPTMHCEALHLVSLVAASLVDPVGPLGGEQGDVVSVSLSHEAALQRVRHQTRTGVALLEDLVGESGGRLKVPGDERPIGGVSTDRIGAADQLSPAAQEQDVQRLLNWRLIDPQRLTAASVPGSDLWTEASAQKDVGIGGSWGDAAHLKSVLHLRDRLTCLHISDRRAAIKRAGEEASPAGQPTGVAHGAAVGGVCL